MLGRSWRYDRRVMHGRVTNRCTFEMNGRPITIVSLTPKQIYTEQWKLKKEKMVENESFHIRGTFFANNNFFGFDDEVILRLGIDLLTLEYAFHNTDSRSNLFKEGKDDTNQVLVMTSNISFSIVWMNFWTLSYMVRKLEMSSSTTWITTNVYL